jgi:hypothetical protein
MGQGCIFVNQQQALFSFAFSFFPIDRPQTTRFGEQQLGLGYKQVLRISILTRHTGQREFGLSREQECIKGMIT